MKMEPLPHRAMSRSISSISAGVYAAGPKETEERGLGADRDPPGNKGPAIRG
jgi:hypothetical protein